MKDPNCIFCKIINGEAPCYKLYEDREFLAILDAFPHVEGQTLIISKNHLTSLFEEIPGSILTKSILLSKKIALALKKGLGASRIIQVIEGLDIAHMHIKLIPVPGDKHFSLARMQQLYPAMSDFLPKEEAEVTLSKIGKIS